MRTFLVGGAVRDALLGRPAGDRDFVVVGATPQQMLDAGYTPVGRDFPVFLHPTTHEEHALARTERKTAPGYRGFVVHAAADVSLEDDLARRDFTINAMAMDEHGALVDPWGGRADLDARVLRHVSPAFVEDPVRILRAARFMARFSPLGFRIAEETLALMRAMVEAGEVDHLVPERVWQELSRGLAEAQPSALLDTLRACGALARVLPQVDALYGVPQRAEFHPEIDAGVHTGMVVDMCARLAPGESDVAFAGLVHDLGKALTPAAEWPRHVAHEHRGLKPLEALCRRLGVPNEHRALAEMACREHLNIHRLDQLRDETVHDLLQRCDAFRRPERIARLALVCEADKRGRLGMAESAYPQAALLLALHRAALAVNARDLALGDARGSEIGARLRAARIAAIAAARRGLTADR